MKAKIKTIIISMIMILVAFSSISITQADESTVTFENMYTFVDSDGSNWNIVALTSGSGNWEVPSGINTIDVLVVAGGGGSGSGLTQASNDQYNGGGGGAGGLIFIQNVTKLSSTDISGGNTISYSIGEGGAGSPDENTDGENGDDTIFGNLTAKGGGYGGCTFERTPGNGGSGGGAGMINGNTGIGGTATQSSQTGWSGIYGYGNNGHAAGGGAGSPAINKFWGGVGMNMSGYFGTEYGGAASDSADSEMGWFASGGGAPEKKGSTAPGADAIVNSGMGGRAPAADSSSSGQDGGSGIILLRYTSGPELVSPEDGSVVERQDYADLQVSLPSEPTGEMETTDTYDTMDSTSWRYPSSADWRNEWINSQNCYGWNGLAYTYNGADQQGFDSFDFNIPDDADVTSVKVEIYTYQDQMSEHMRMRVGGSAGFTSFTGYQEIYRYGYTFSRTFDVSSEGWKGSDINGNNLKVHAEAKYEIGRSGGTYGIRYVRARVYYTPAPAEPPELVSPEDGEVLDRQNYADLEVTADTTVSFYDASDDSLLGTDDTSDGGIYSYNWTGLTPGQTYSWYVSADGATSDTWTFTPNDEPEIQNLRIQEINSKNATFEWNNEPNTEWISLKVGSDIMEVRRLTTTHQTWTVENLYPDYPYYFQWQIGDDLNSFSDYYEFDFRTDGWNPNLEDYSYRKLITIDSDDISSDQDDTAYFLNLTEDNFRYSSGDNWWDPTYPAFTHLDYTNYDDIRFTNYYDTNMLEYDITKWDVPGDGGLEEQTLPDESYYTGSFINPSYAHDDDWTTKATPSTHGTLYYNYTIPADAKTTSKLRTYQGDWIWDITLSEGAFNGSKLQFKTTCDYDAPYVSTYVWNYDTNDWELAQDTAYGSSNSTARYFYESMMTWEYDCEANIHVMTEYFDDDTRTYVDGVDGDYDVKFWMYYGNDNPSSDGPYDFVSYETADCTIGSEDSYQLPAPEIENVAVSDLTTSTANISFDTTEISDSYIDIAENEWILNSTIANRTIQRTEEFTHLSGDDEHTEQLGVFSPYFNQTISVVCSNTSYNTNYSVNSSTGDSPVEITFEDVNAGEFLNWTVTYSMFKVIERDELNHEFMLTELDNNKEYYYRINASNNGGSDTYIGSFTLGTPPSTPDTNITTYIEDRPDEKVTVTGELTDMDGASNVDVQIQYWKEGDTTFSWTPTVTLNSVDTFQENISVEYGNKYYYRVKAVGDTTGYSDAYSNLFMDIQEFFAGSYVEDDDNNDENEYGRSRQYLPTKPDGTVNESATAYEQTGYWEGSLQEEDWMWVETNINQNLPLTIKLYTKADGHVGDYTMNNDADSDMQYYKLETLENKWYTFHIVNNNSDMVLNWTKPSPIHNVGETRRDESKYVSFNGTPENIDYELLYMDYKFYNTSAYQYAINELGGDIYTAMAVEYFGGGRGAGIGPDVSGTAYDRGRLFRGGIINGELDDTGMLNPTRPDLGEGAERHCYAFTVYWWNTSIIPTNNIENYYYHYWTSNSWWSEYFGHPQTRTFDFNSLFSWGYDELSQTRDWKYIDDATVTEETLVENVSASVFDSDYDQSLMIGYKDGFSVDTSDDKIYNMGFYTDGRWTNQQLGPHQQGYVAFNLPDNATLQAMDSDSDGLNDYEELFTYYTNPKCNDTDEDGQNDGFEVNSGVNPNLYTSYNKPPQITLNNPYEDTYTIGRNISISADVIDLEGESKTYEASIWKDDVLQEYVDTGTGDSIEVDWETTTETPGNYEIKIETEDVNGFQTTTTRNISLKYHKMQGATIPDNSDDISIYQTEDWSIYIDYALNPTFNWTIETSPDIGSASGTDDTPGYKTVTFTNMEPSTHYTIYVNATGSSTNETYDFNTSAEHVEIDWNYNLYDVKKGEDVNIHLAVDPHDLWIDTVATDEITWTQSLLEYPGSNVDWGNLFEETWAQINGTVDNTNGTITNVVWGNGDTNESGILYYLNFTTGEGTGIATVDLTESLIGVAMDMEDVNWSYLGPVDVFIHYYIPDAPTDFTASKEVPLEIELNWTKDTTGNYGINPDDGTADTTYIERNTVANWTRGTGTFIYNDTGSSYTDTVPDSKEHYYYQAWSYNATDNLYSPLNSSDDITSMNYPPDTPQLEYPANGAPYESVYDEYLNVTVTDSDGDSMDVEFYWNDGTHIGTIYSVANNSTASCYLPDYIDPDWLNHDTTYSWYAIANDTTTNPTEGFTNQSDTWTFDTSHYTDTNEDGTIDYLDVSYLSGHYRQSCSPGEYGWDIIGDGNSNYLDVSALVSDYGETFP